jgi:MFS family permease
VHIRLSLLLFLVYAPLGAMWPLFSRRLEMLHFSPTQIAYAFATQALGALLAPLLAGQVADRWISAERCLACCAFAAGMSLWSLADCTTPAEVFVASLGFFLFASPTMSLGASICFAQLSEPRRQFGRIRLWGTIGWIVPGWLIGYALAQPAWLTGLLQMLRSGSAEIELVDAFRLGALLTFLQAMYALTLPGTPPRRDAPDLLAPVAALRLLRRRDFAVFFLCHLALCLTLPFGSQNTVLFLGELGIQDEWKAPAMTIAQSTEVLTLGLLPWLLARWGQRRIMLLGAGAWALALAVLTLGQPTFLVVASLSLNGLYITCFLVAGQVYINSHASEDVRASAQALITFTTGIGMLAGSLLAGKVRQLAGEAFRPTFAVAAMMAVVAVLVFALGFFPISGDSRAS